ncbi:unnamed protein product [Symbiodinium pilosum]|uniref:Uncharacterized protein n=1 Tax=Symbiodinium pilosum TaxID=2952 RepID=A0A812LQK9_SYMPI|nr:unnamed protein product [Symbiodinium pilosum]
MVEVLLRCGLLFLISLGGASAERSLIDREEVREEIAAHVQESHSEQDGGEHHEPGKHDIRVYDGYRYSELQLDIKHPQKRWANLICAENERRKGYTMAEWFHWCKDKRNRCTGTDSWMAAKKKGREDPGVLEDKRIRECRPADFRLGHDGHWYLLEEFRAHFDQPMVPGMGEAIFNQAPTDLLTWYRRRDQAELTGHR